MWSVGQVVDSVASAIADFPVHPPEDFNFLHNASIMYSKP